MEPNFKIYFSKSSHCPCVDYDGKILKAMNLEVNVSTKGEWQPVGESPSWTIVGQANEIVYDEERDTIMIF